MLLALPCLAACGGGHRPGRTATTFAPPAGGPGYRVTGVQPKHLHPPEPTRQSH